MSNNLDKTAYFSCTRKNFFWIFFGFQIVLYGDEYYYYDDDDEVDGDEENDDEDEDKYDEVDEVDEVDDECSTSKLLHSPSQPREQETTPGSEAASSDCVHCYFVLYLYLYLYMCICICL